MMYQDAEQLALELMRKHKKLDDWKFKFHNRKRSLGTTFHHNKTICLSRPYVLLNDEQIIREVILHEIAHALLPPYIGHGVVWKAKAIEVGCNPRRICDNCISPPKKYLYECPNCKRQVRRDKRFNKRKIACGICCKKFNKGKFCDKFIFVEVIEKWRIELKNAAK